MPKLIKPGDPEYETFIKGVTEEDVNCLRQTLQQEGVANAVHFERTGLARGVEVEYAAIKTAEGTAKIVMHFEHVAPNMMNRIGEFFYKNVRGVIVGPADPAMYMEVGRNVMNPVSAWDVAILNLSAMNAPAQLRLILKALKKEFPV